MRYSLLSTAIIGAATVSGLAIPEMEARSNHELDETCQVQEVVVVLTPLDEYVGHTFDLLTPEAALSGLVDSFNNITNPDDIDVNSPTGIIPPPQLISYNPTEFYSTIANVPTAAPSAEIPSASGGFPGEQPPFPTGGLGDMIGDIGDQVGDMASGIMGTGTGGLTIPTGLPGLGDIGDSFSSYLNEIPELSTALDYLTRSYDMPIPIPTDSPTSSIPTPTAPFPVPGGNGTTTGGPSGTSALPTGIPTTTSESSTSSTSSTSISSSSSSTSSTTTSSSSTATPSPTGCASPRVRPEWRNMPLAARQAYANAIECLLDAPSQGQRGARNRYEDLASVHQQMTPTIHGTGQFLAWHRYFLHMQETLLRNECGYTGPIPWWDETLDAGNFAQSPVFDSRYLGSAIVKTAQGQGACVNDGVMEGRQINIGPGSANQPRCLARAIDEGLSANVNNNFWSVCNGRQTYADMASCSEGGPHGYGHNAVGAVMADVASSPTDPVFYLHHGMIDRAWMMWQRQSPNHAQAMGGVTSPGGSTPTTRDFILSGRGIIPDVPISRIMDTESEYLCYTYDY